MDEQQPKEKRSRVNDPELQKRIRNVQEWILKGESTSDMVVSMVDMWKVSERTAFRYLADAYKTFKEDNSPKLKASKAYHIAARKRLLKATMDNDPATALKVLQDMGKIEGIYAPERVDHTTKGEKIGSARAVLKLSDGTEIELE